MPQRVKYETAAVQTVGAADFQHAANWGKFHLARRWSLKKHSACSAYESSSNRVRWVFSLRGRGRRLLCRISPERAEGRTVKDCRGAKCRFQHRGQSIWSACGGNESFKGHKGESKGWCFARVVRQHWEINEKIASVLGKYVLVMQILKEWKEGLKIKLTVVKIWDIHQKVFRGNKILINVWK